MTREKAMGILTRLEVYYPRTYIKWTEKQKAIFCEDICNTLASFKDETIFRAYREWHEEKNTAPTTADILKRCRGLENFTTNIPEVEFEFWTDKNGYEYARVKS